MSYFYGKSDKNFLLSVLNHEKLEYNYNLLHPNLIIDRISILYFENFEILNFAQFKFSNLALAGAASAAKFQNSAHAIYLNFKSRFGLYFNDALNLSPQAYPACAAAIRNEMHAASLAPFKMLRIDTACRVFRLSDAN